VLRSADRVIATARDVFEKARLNGVPDERLTLLTPGIEKKFFAARPAPERVRNRYGIKGKRVMLTVGRLVRRKGHELVIGLLPAIKERCGEVVYLIAGSGPDEQRLRRVAEENGVAGSVLFLGRLPYDALLDCYAAADIFVMPNRELPDGDTEGAGMVFLEAAAMGKPVIAGTAGGTGDSVIDGETGYRVDADRPADLLEKVCVLLRDSALAERMGAAGRRMAEEGRRWEDRADELMRICGKLIGTG
jgi:phosphatidylinositol alpha-1,6-mannosyltransferase